MGANDFGLYWLTCKDIAILCGLVDAGEILHIKVLDSIIVTDEGFWSASDAGVI